MMSKGNDIAWPHAAHQRRSERRHCTRISALVSLSLPLIHGDARPSGFPHATSRERGYVYVVTAAPAAPLGACATSTSTTRAWRPLLSIECHPVHLPSPRRCLEASGGLHSPIHRGGERNIAGPLETFCAGFQCRASVSNSPVAGGGEAIDLLLLEQVRVFSLCCLKPSHLLSLG